jgi:hypothetical protein
MPSQMVPPASGAHGTCPACHALDTPLGPHFDTFYYSQGYGGGIRLHKGEPVLPYKLL